MKASSESYTKAWNDAIIHSLRHPSNNNSFQALYSLPGMQMCKARSLRSGKIESHHLYLVKKPEM